MKSVLLIGLGRFGRGVAEKLNELHANSVSPKKIKEVSGDSKEEVLQKVMNFVDKFDAKQKELENEEKGKVVKLRPTKKSAAGFSYILPIPATGRTYGYGKTGSVGRLSNMSMEVCPFMLTHFT